MINILGDYKALLGNEGLEGLKKSYENQASLTMKEDQQKIVDFVNRHLLQQLKDPHKEIIVISGGPGTGKTIVGIRFILEYVKIFNNGENDNKVIFCLPRSKTVKAMFDAACGVDEEHEKEYCCYLHEIADKQNLVVVDEAHRITKLEKSLDDVFRQGTKLLILLQDDHQMLRPGEEGTYSKIKEFAESRHIQFSPADAEEKNILTLIDEKRCDEKLLRGLEKLFYDECVTVDEPINNIKIFDQIENFERWKNQKAINSRTKYILPFCWPWKSKNHSATIDISIGEFKKTWNPEDTDDQVLWLNDPSDDRAACIYTSQGLDMDNVAFIWWDDLKWNEEKFEWEGNITKLEDPSFKNGGKNLQQEELDLLIKNTYYVMMTRPRNELAIWFHDISTKKHVLEVLGLVSEEGKKGRQF